jgi:hypothetical protein
LRKECPESKILFALCLLAEKQSGLWNGGAVHEPEFPFPGLRFDNLKEKS